MLKEREKHQRLYKIHQRFKGSIRLLTLLILFCSYVGFGELSLNKIYAQSPMKTGKWAKIAFKKSGLYVLDSQELQNLGLTSIDQVCVWGYGGGLMPEVIGEVASRGLVQVPTLLRDGKLYFYADGLTLWDYNAEDDFYHHRTNHYSNKAYLLLSEGTSAQPLRMKEEKVKFSSEPMSKASRSYLQTILKDFNGYSLAHSGRRLYDKQLYQNNQATFPISNSESLRLSLSYMAYPKKGQEGINVLINGQKFMETSISQDEVAQQIGAFSYSFYGMDKSVTPQQSYKLQPEDKSFQITFQPQNRSNRTQINYYELNVLTELTKLEGQCFLRRSPKFATNVGSEAHYSLPNTKGLYLFALDKSEYFGANETKLIVYPEDKVGQGLELSLKTKSHHSAPRSYLALSLDKAYKVEVIGEVANQDILGDKRQVNLLILCPESLKEEALPLQKHYEKQGKRVLVCTQEEVFNAFNGGTPDAMAYRLLAKHYYDSYKGMNTDGLKTSPLSLLLFGDAAYDNRLLSQEWQKENLKKTDFLLSYQSLNSLDLTTYTSDDFFAGLQDAGLSPNYKGKGKGLESINFERDYIPDLAKELMTISVGRLPLRNKAEAKAVVAKIIAYDTEKSVGAWKTKAAFVADNGDGNSHTEQSLEISKRLEDLSPTIQLNRIYMSSYMREFSGGRATLPKAKKDFFEALDKGLMLVNYNGHGSPNAWATENILTFADIQAFGYKHLPLWITATCDFSPFDVPSTSAGESILLQPNSGGIALLSTTRIVWDIPNKILNKALIEELFTPQEDGSYLMLGEAVRRAKNRLRDKSTPENRLNFVLLGSPLQSLVLPKDRVVLSQVNNKDVKEQSVIKVHSLDRVQLAGYIKKGLQGIDGNFQGKLEVLIYDGEDEVETIDNFNDSGSAVTPVKYKDFLNLIYTSTVDIKDGQFSFDFVVPKDVAYSGKLGKVNFYAYDVKGQKEFTGYARNLMIEAGGGAKPSTDNKAPEILEIKLSNKDVKPNLIVPEISQLYVLIKEQTGVNLSNAGLGHRMTLQIDGAKGLSLDLSPYYSNSSTQKGLGIIKLVLPRLSNGKHSAELRICDVYNNVTIKQFDFIVRQGLEPNIEELKVSMVKDGYLIVKHDQAAMPLQGDVEVFDLCGRLLLSKKHLSFSPSSGYVAYSLQTLGLDAIKYLPPEVYIFRLSLRSKSKDSAVGSKAVKFSKP